MEDDSLLLQVQKQNFIYDTEHVFQREGEGKGPVDQQRQRDKLFNTGVAGQPEGGGLKWLLMVMRRTPHARTHVKLG